jgi:3-hydroxyacyl-CoA dehydrogenase
MSTDSGIKKVAILGAGVMGAQLAALFANSNIKVFLFDIKCKDNPSNNAVNAIKHLKKLKPEPLAVPANIKYIIPCNYTDDAEKIAETQLIIEAVSENIDIKASVFENIKPHITKNTIITTNTSGLSIEDIAACLPKDLRPNFFGAHFFNPPRYLPLVELIYHAKTDISQAERMADFLTRKIGKSVIIAPNTPNFIANRIGIFSLLSTTNNCIKHNIALEVADKLTGTAIMRPKSATFRTADVVGLDILQHAASTSATIARDPWQQIYNLPILLNDLIAAGALGQKAGKGIYEKRKDGIYVYDLKAKDYRLADKEPGKELLELLKTKDMPKIFKELSASTDKEYKFLWQTFADLLHYSAYVCESLNISAREIDMAIKLGFGWDLGPFEIWQKAGIKPTSALITASILNNDTYSSTPLPAWTAETDYFYKSNLAFNPSENKYIAPTKCAAEARQIFPKTIYTDIGPKKHICFENDAAELWTTGDDIGIFSLKTKLATINSAALEAIFKATDIADKEFKAMVIWHPECQNFGAGANLMELAEEFFISGITKVESIIKEFQLASLRLRYSNTPTIAAVRGFALGGSCEIMLHCNRRVVAQNSYIGLVETGVGIIPAAAGSKEMALKALCSANPKQSLRNNYHTIALGKVATSAQMALEMNFLQHDDVIISHPDELLYVAKQQALAMAESNFTPPQEPIIKVAGKPALANMELEIANMKAGNFISEHDYLIAKKLATVMCGGNLASGTTVSESFLLKLERDAFLELVQTPKSQERIEYMLETGKRLRN